MILPEKKCANCGKNFIPAPYHAFKKNEKYYCKYTCYIHRNDGLKFKKRGIAYAKTESDQEACGIHPDD